MKFLKFAIITVIVLALTGCYFPDKFNSKIFINKDFSYNVNFDGEVVLAAARAEEIQSKKSLSSKDEKDLASLVKDFKKDKNIKSTEYLGHGKYHIVLEAKGVLKDNERIAFPGQSNDTALYYLKRKGNIVSFEFAKLDKKANDQLAELNLNKVDWNIELKTPGTVIDSNSQSKPILGFGSYKWVIKDTSDKLPYARIQLQ